MITFSRVYNLGEQEWTEKEQKHTYTRKVTIPYFPL